MSITNTTLASPTYNGNGSTTAFATGFQFIANADLKVTVTDSSGVPTVQTLTTDYTVTGAGNSSGGTVTFVTAPAAGTKVNIESNVTIDQQTDYVEGGSFAASTHETALDKLTKIAQQLQAQIDRSFQFPVVNQSIDPVTDTATASYLLRVNAAADGLEWVSATDAALSSSLTPTDGGFVVGDGSDFVVETGSTARTSLGLGTIATQSAASVAVTGGTITGITDLAVADGGTGASTAADARTNLGLVIGTDVQAYSADILENVVEDTTPQLGGDLDVNGHKIVSASNGNIDIEPNGTGNVLLGNFTFDADQTVGAGQDNYVLTYDNGTGLISLEAAAGGGGGLANVVEDTTPQLGGNLDVNGHSIVSASAGNISITPDTTGDLILDGLKWPQADGTANYVLKTDGSGQLSWTAQSSGTAATQSDQETATSTTTYVSPGRQQYHPSAAKAWVKFTSVTTTAIGASYNVTSLTDNGVGDTTVTLTTGFSSATNYCAVGACATGVSATGNGVMFAPIATPTATTYRVLTVAFGTGNSTDYAYSNIAFFGDQ